MDQGLLLPLSPLTLMMSTSTCSRVPAMVLVSVLVALLPASASARPSDRGVPSPRTIITLIPIQITTAITVSQAKLDKSFRFFERRAAWTADFKDDASACVDLRFAFVVRHCAMQADRAAVPVDRDGTSTFALSFISLAAIDVQLDRAVDSPCCSWCIGSTLEFASAAASL